MNKWKWEEVESSMCRQPTVQHQRDTFELENIARLVRVTTQAILLTNIKEHFQFLENYINLDYMVHTLSTDCSLVSPVSQNR